MSRLSRCSTYTSALLVLCSIWEAGYVWAGPPAQAGFPKALNGDRVRYSSISLGDLNNDGLPDIVVGTNDGKVHAYTGAGVKLWERDTGDMGIEGKAAIGDLDRDGFNEVVVGAGSTFTPNAHGGLYVLNGQTGVVRCDFKTLDATSVPDGWRDGVYSSPALADLDGDDGGLLEIAFGAWDRRVRVINHDCSKVWEINVYDAVWASPAIGDVNRDGQLDVVIGVDADHLNPPMNAVQDGGLIYVYNGKTGAVAPGFPRQVDEVLWSSPALGDLDGDGFLEVVVGTGYCWANPNCAVGRDNPNVGKEIHAWDHLGNPLPGWPVDLVDKYAFASPALADLDGDGDLEVIVNTIDPDDNQAGLVYALNADGSNVPGWPTRPTTVVPTGPSTFNTFHTSTEASPVVADLTGDGHLEVLLASSFEIVVWDRDGNQLTLQTWPPPPADFNLTASFAVSSSPAVGDLDGDGDVEVVVGSATDISGSVGQIYAWDFAGAASPAALPWPMFRANAPSSANSSGVPIFADGFESGDVSRWTAPSP